MDTTPCSPNTPLALTNGTTYNLTLWVRSSPVYVGVHLWPALGKFNRFQWGRIVWHCYTWLDETQVMSPMLLNGRSLYCTKLRSCRCSYELPCAAVLLHDDLLASVRHSKPATKIGQALGPGQPLALLLRTGGSLARRRHKLRPS